jgi:predicted acylesterase/phospholipase RssA
VVQLPGTGLDNEPWERESSNCIPKEVLSMTDGYGFKSIHFARCIGVFEGGGIRGAAHAGAFLGSVASGIDFEATIGSSAGSMIAVLIAAGLTPAQVIEELSLDLSSLLVPSESGSLLGAVGICLSGVLGPTTQSILRAHYRLGLYTSAPLRAWMNRTLRKYLPKSSDPVVFRDLHKPVAVMATDVLARKPKVWSRERDPATPVAYAVEASCAIPFFSNSPNGRRALHTLCSPTAPRISWGRITPRARQPGGTPTSGIRT